MTPADGVGERVRNTRATADRLLVVVAGPNGAGKSTLKNLTQALEFVDHAFVFDNSSAKEPFRFVAEFSNGALVRRGKRRPKWAVSLLKTFSKAER
jgi:predicted ABC-type ATPase